MNTRLLSLASLLLLTLHACQTTRSDRPSPSDDDERDDDDDEDPPSDDEGEAGSGGRGGAGGSGGGSGGRGGSQNGGRGGEAGTGGSGGSAGNGGSMGLDAAVGGQPGGDASAAGGAGGQAAPFDPKTSFASAFHGHRWEVPCRGATFTTAETCYWDPQKFAQNTKKMTTFTGEAGRLYDVGIRIRGVVEPRTYLVDGKIHDPGSKPAFLAGGTPAPGNDYNIYRIVVSKPAKTYYLNAYKQTAHLIFDIDYKATIRVEGGATVSLEAQDSNTEAIANHKRLVIPDVPPAPEPFNGQFIQLDVTSVTRVDP